MTLFETEPLDSTHRRVFLLGAQIGSLLLTGWLVWALVTAPPFFRDSLATAIGRVLGLALLAWIWSATILAGLYFIFAEAVSEHLWRILKTSTAAVWFAPATILLAERSPATMFAALVLVINTTRLLYCDWCVKQSDPIPPLPLLEADCLFQQYALPSPTFSRQFAPAMMLAFFIQAGAAAAIMRYPMLAAACFALGVAFITAFCLAIGILSPERPRDLPHSILGVIVTVLLAAALTLGGSPGRLFRGSGEPPAWTSRRPPGLIDTLKSLLPQWSYSRKLPTAPESSGAPGQPGVPEPGHKSVSGQKGSGSSAPGYEPVAGGGKFGDFPGVILRPEVTAVTPLVAPVPTGVGFSAHAPHPLGIPFSGEYWIFREPNRRPPYGSYFERASPARLGFLSRDHGPLQMEAHHKLDQPISLRCCSKARIAIWNGDAYPGTIELELILIDREPPKRLSQSLGAAAVRSAPGDVPVPETLEFSIPAEPELDQFDEFKVVFHRDPKRMDKSARIEISRFVLVPAGR